NDQAETVLLRLLRGSGAKGLGGIYPVLEGKVARPFLNLTRAEVEAELSRRKLGFRLDSSNRDVRFLRNKVRAELLPLLFILCRGQQISLYQLLHRLSRASRPRFHE
ncbi:MAG: hypothetical protein KGO23_11975, partial [Nitrospirota bacterium]|nr:hypothetical protein [Nitrospirota bacterium]